MLVKKQRLTTKEFNRFFSSGKRYHSPSLQIVYSPHTQFHGSVVVGKKVYKRAVDRNKLRRQIYSILYAASKTKILLGVYVIMAKPGSKDVSFLDIKKEIHSLLKKIEHEAHTR